MVITTPEEHEEALAEAGAIMDRLPDIELALLSPSDALDWHRLDELADAIEAYEKIHYPFED